MQNVNLSRWWVLLVTLIDKNEKKIYAVCHKTRKEFSRDLFAFR